MSDGYERDPKRGWVHNCEFYPRDAGIDLGGGSTPHACFIADTDGVRPMLDGYIIAPKEKYKVVPRD